MPKPALFGAFLVSMVSLAATAQPIELQQGLWRVMVKTTTNGKSEPPQDDKVCLKDELKDPARYFAPELEGVKAKCTRTSTPQKDKNALGHRLKCTGSNFTMDATTNVTVLAPDHFTMAMRIDSKAPKQQAVVIAEGEARRVGACP